MEMSKRHEEWHRERQHENDNLVLSALMQQDYDVDTIIQPDLDEIEAKCADMHEFNLVKEYHADASESWQVDASKHKELLAFLKAKHKDWQLPFTKKNEHHKNGCIFDPLTGYCHECFADNKIKLAKPKPLPTIAEMWAKKAKTRRIAKSQSTNTMRIYDEMTLLRKRVNAQTTTMTLRKRGKAQE